MSLQVKNLYPCLNLPVLYRLSKQLNIPDVIPRTAGNTTCQIFIVTETLMKVLRVTVYLDYFMIIYQSRLGTTPIDIKGSYLSIQMGEVPCQKILYFSYLWSLYSFRKPSNVVIIALLIVAIKLFYSIYDSQDEGNRTSIEHLTGWRIQHAFDYFVIAELCQAAIRSK